MASRSTTTGAGPDTSDAQHAQRAPEPPPGHTERISLIMPTRNEGARVRRTVDSLLQNTFYPDVEVLILDDASEDGSCDFMAASPYAEDPRLRLIRAASQKGHLALRIEATQQATGSVFQFLDAHHCFSPYWLTNLYDSLRRRDFQALVGPVVTGLDPGTWQPNSRAYYGWTCDPTLAQSHPLNQDEIGPDGRVNWLSGHQVMVHRQVYEIAGGLCPLFRGHGTDDVDFCLRAFLMGYDCYIEPTAMIGHLFKRQFVNPVSWADLALNRLLLIYLNLGGRQLQVFVDQQGEQPGYAEAIVAFEQIRSQADAFRRPMASRQRRSAEELMARFKQTRYADEFHSPRLDPPEADLPLSSIVIPSHNEGRNVQRTVDSILAHTRAPFEIILIDDGSSDGSFAFLEQAPYQGEGRLRQFRFEESVGCIRARHQGVELARGDQVLFLDAHMALPAGWLAGLSRALERRGPNAVITADVSTLDEESWTPRVSTGQVLCLDEKMGFVWKQPPYPSGLVPTAGGCCVLLRRDFYQQIGGFDLGLRRWGSVFVDLVLKAYAAGGACYYEPSVCVGHLFRSPFPYKMRYRDLNYNRLRTGYVHLDDGSFQCFVEHLRDEPVIKEAMDDLAGDLPELARLRQRQRSINRRRPDWFVTMFVPALRPPDQVGGELPSGCSSGEQTACLPETKIKEGLMSTRARSTICPACGATNVGRMDTCLRCGGALDRPAVSSRIQAPLPSVAVHRRTPPSQREQPSPATLPEHSPPQRPPGSTPPKQSAGPPPQAAPARPPDLPERSTLPAQKRFCTRCGAQAKPDAVFCNRCGAKLR